MDWNLVIIVIVAALLAVLFFKLLRSIIKAILYALGFLALGLLIFGLIAYSDIRAANNVLQHGEKAIVFVADNPEIGVLLGNQTELSFSPLKGFSDNISTLQGSELEGFIGKQSEDNTSEDLIIIIHEEWLAAVDGEFDVFGLTLTQDDAIATLTSDDPASVLRASSSGSQAAFIDAISPDELKGVVLISVFSDAMRQAGSEQVIRGIKEETLEVYPSFLSIDLLKMIPQKPFDAALETGLGFRLKEVEE